MIATLEFTLPEEREEFDQAANATSMYCLLCDVSEHLRGRIKYGELSGEIVAELDAIRGMLMEWQARFHG